MATSKPTFEKAMKQLEQIVDDLESGTLPLEKALKKFEEGIELSRYCNEKLEETERRIALLTADADGRPVEAPFPADSDEDAPV
jgi:exodeoxyribonuclease VII small subunit